MRHGAATQHVSPVVAPRGRCRRSGLGPGTVSKFSALRRKGSPRLAEATQWDRGLPPLGYLPLAKQRWAPLCACRLGLGPGRPRARIRGYGRHPAVYLLYGDAFRLFTVCRLYATGTGPDTVYAMELFDARCAQKERLRCYAQAATVRLYICFAFRALP